MQAAGKRYIVCPSRSEQVEICHISDCHLMNRACAKELLQEDIEYIRTTPNAFWFGGGDYVDLIGSLDHRFDPDAVDEMVSVRDLGRLGEKGFGLVEKTFKPIAHKCLGMLKGNHEYKFEVFQQQQDRMERLCYALGVPDLKYCAFVDVVLCRNHKTTTGHAELVSTYPRKGNQHRWTTRFFLHHGSGFAVTAGGKLKRLEDFMRSFDADVYLLGHVHDRQGCRKSRIAADRDCKKLAEVDQLGMIAGSYLKTYQHDMTTYGEQRGYAPTNMGMVSIKLEMFRDGGGKAHAEL